MRTRNMGTRNTELRNKEHGIQELGTRNSEHRNSEHGLTTYEVGAAFGSGNQSLPPQSTVKGVTSVGEGVFLFVEISTLRDL